MSTATYITKAVFDEGCMLTGKRDSWCSVPGKADLVRPGTAGTAEYLVRTKRNAKAAAIIGRDHTDLAACARHAEHYVGLAQQGYQVIGEADIAFANA